MRTLYSGIKFSVISIDVKTKEGKLVPYEVVKHPGAVVILPFLDSQNVILIKNERPAVKETLWELPAGTLEPNESALLCAKRELEEETGYIAGEISSLFSFFTTPGFSNEKLEIFVARDLVKHKQKLDHTENIEVFSIPLEKALQMIKSGEIIDAKTIATLLYYKTYAI